MDTNPEGSRNEGKSPDDRREACLMCGACEIIEQVCALHASPEEDLRQMHSKSKTSVP